MNRRLGVGKVDKMFNSRQLIGPKIAVMIAGLGLALSVSAAHAVTVTFDRITSNSSADAASQLVLDVTDDAANNRALMAFSVIAGSNPGANIAEIYFSDVGSIFTPPPILVGSTGTVSFEAGGTNNPPNLPGANNANPAFVTTAFLVAEADGNNATGVTVGESITLGLNYASGFSWSDLLTALGNGNFRTGLHVRSLLAGESDSFVSKPPNGGGGGPPPVVPLPAGLPLMLSALGIVAVVRRKSRKTA